MATSINHKIFFSQPPADVWDFLTVPELIEQWLMKNDFKPIVGHQFQFRTNPLPKMNFDGIAHCTVLELVPHQKLTYSWKGGPGNGELTLDSVVTWTLTPKGEGTELELVHSGFDTEENFIMYSAMNDGWLRNMHKIADLLNKRTNDTAHA